jgi:hypothetical protein
MNGWAGRRLPPSWSFDFDIFVPKPALAATHASNNKRPTPNTAQDCPGNRVCTCKPPKPDSLGPALRSAHHRPLCRRSRTISTPARQPRGQAEPDLTNRRYMPTSTPISISPLMPPPPVCRTCFRKRLSYDKPPIGGSFGGSNGVRQMSEKAGATLDADSKTFPYGSQPHWGQVKQNGPRLETLKR